MALGARIQDVVSLTLREGMGLVSAGMMIALVAATLASRIVGRFLYDVEPLDPGSWAWSIVILLGVGTLATLVPASRSARIDPVSALQQTK